MKTSITTNQNKDLGYGQTGNLAHNRREFTPKNVDPQLTKNNIVFVDKTLAEVYEECFGDAIDDYNRKQKRSDRKKYDRKSYFKHLFHHDPDSESAQVILTSNARGKHEIKSYYEELSQLGGCEDFGLFMRDEYGNFIDKDGNPVKWDKYGNKYYDINGNAVTDSRNLMPNPKAKIAEEILEIYFNGGRFKMIEDQNGNMSLKRLDDNDPEIEDIYIPSFEERNPYFRVVYAAIHNDEWHGTPHIHIDIVPVGTGYVKGPEKQVGYERALANMGYKNKNTAFIDWRDDERDILKGICRCYGLETKTKDEERLNNRGETYATKVYRQAIREGKADAQEIVKKAKQDALNITEKSELDAKATAERAEQEAENILDNAKLDANAVKEQAQAEAANIIEEAKQDAEDIFKQAECENKQIAEENERLNNDIRDKRIQIALLADIAAKMPKKKIKLFSGSEKYEMDKKVYDDYMESVEMMKRYSNNTLTSDEDKKAAEVERRRAEQLSREANLRIKRQAEQLADQMTQQLRDKLNHEIEECTKINKNLTLYVFNTADRMLKRVSPTYARQDKESRKAQLERAYLEDKKDKHLPKDDLWVLKK
ncbi:MAG: hypothetical protein ACI4SF_03630 [Oscillospiraceae bacterium]